MDWTLKALAESEFGEVARQQILEDNAAAMFAHRALSRQREKTAV
jgi:hypothetical protein